MIDFAMKRAFLVLLTAAVSALLSMHAASAQTRTNLELKLTDALKNIRDNWRVELRPANPTERPKPITVGGSSNDLWIAIEYAPYLMPGSYPIFFATPTKEGGAFSSAGTISAVEGSIRFVGYFYFGKKPKNQGEINQKIEDILNVSPQFDLVDAGFGTKWLDTSFDFQNWRRSPGPIPAERQVLPTTGQPIFFGCVIERGCADSQRKLLAELISDDKRRGLVSLKIRILAFGSGKPESGFHVRAVSDCLARSGGDARSPADGTADVPLPSRSSKPKESVCFVVSRRQSTDEGCFVRAREDAEAFARAGIPLDLPTDTTYYPCPNLPPLTVRFMGENREIPLAELQRYVGEVKVAGVPLTTPILTQYRPDLPQLIAASLIEFGRPGWIIADNPSYKVVGAGAELLVPLRRNFLNANTISLSLESSGGTFEPNCKPILDVPAAQLMTLDAGRDGQVSTTDVAINFVSLQERKVYELEQGPTRFIKLEPQLRLNLRFADSDSICKLEEDARKFELDEIKRGPIVRVVRKTGTVIVSILTASYRLREVDPKFVGRTYQLALETVDVTLAAELKKSPRKVVERQYLVEWLRTSRPDNTEPRERMSPGLQSQIFVQPNDRNTFLNEFLYNRNALSRNEPSIILTREARTTSGDPSSLDTFINEFLVKRGIKPSKVDHTIILIGRTPEDGGSLCTNWRSLGTIGAKRRIVVIEFATRKMLEARNESSVEFQNVKLDSSLVRVCKAIPDSMASQIGVYLVVVPDVVALDSERNDAQQILGEVLARYVGEN